MKFAKWDFRKTFAKENVSRSFKKLMMLFLLMTVIVSFQNCGSRSFVPVQPSVADFDNDPLAPDSDGSPGTPQQGGGGTSSENPDTVDGTITNNPTPPTTPAPPTTPTVVLNPNEPPTPTVRVFPPPTVEDPVVKPTLPPPVSPPPGEVSLCEWKDYSTPAHSGEIANEVCDSKSQIRPGPQEACNKQSEGYVFVKKYCTKQVSQSGLAQIFWSWDRRVCECPKPVEALPVNDGFCSYKPFQVADEMGVTKCLASQTNGECSVTFSVAKIAALSQIPWGQEVKSLIFNHNFYTNTSSGNLFQNNVCADWSNDQRLSYSLQLQQNAGLRAKRLGGKKYFYTSGRWENNFITLTGKAGGWGGSGGRGCVDQVKGFIEYGPSDCTPCRIVPGIGPVCEQPGSSRCDGPDLDRLPRNLRSYLNYHCW
jgi:hypothetical protein